MRALIMCLALWTLGILTPAPAAAKEPVSVHIQVIEATRTGTFDPRLSALKGSLPGYQGAKLVDEITTNVDKGSSVSVEILGRTKMLKVTPLKIDPDAIRLKLDIEAMKFSIKTTHKKGNATVVLAITSGDKARFLAVTPTFQQ